MVGAAAGAGLGHFVSGLEQLALAGTAAAGFLAGSFIAFVLGAMTRVKQSEAWELTHQSVGEGTVGVGVRTRLVHVAAAVAPGPVGDDGGEVQPLEGVHNIVGDAVRIDPCE